MTRYTVVWSHQAQNQLAQIWLDADDRQAVSAAAHTIDLHLAADPEEKGAALKEGLRTLDIPPLHALFEVLELDRMVRIVLVRAENKPPSGSPTDGDGQRTV